MSRVKFIDVPEVPGTGGCFQLPPAGNPIWNVPAGTSIWADIRGEVRTVGMWNIIAGYRALAVAKGGSIPKGMMRIYGMRALSAPRESGYHLEGRCSVPAHGGRKSFRGFTGSARFIPEGGKGCIDVACIHVCIDRDRCTACGMTDTGLRPRMQNRTCPKCGNVGRYAPGVPIGV